MSIEEKLDEIEDRIRDLFQSTHRMRYASPEQHEILEKMYQEREELYNLQEELEKKTKGKPILEYLKKRELGKGRSKHYSSPLFRIYGGVRDSLLRKIKRVLNTYTDYNDEDKNIISNWLSSLFDGHIEEDEVDFENLLLNYIQVNKRKIKNILQQHHRSGGSRTYDEDATRNLMKIIIDEKILEILKNHQVPETGGMGGRDGISFSEDEIEIIINWIMMEKFDKIINIYDPDDRIFENNLKDFFRQNREDINFIINF